MAIEYLLVTYPDQRSVLADDSAVGVTNHTLMLPSGEYIITLDGSGYTPSSQDVVLSGTSIVKPTVITFTPSAAAPRAAPPVTARATPPAPRRKPKKNA